MQTTNLLSKTDLSGLIELRDLPDSVTANIHEQVTRLRQEYRYITACQVNIKAPAVHPEGCYQIQIAMTLADRVVKIDRSPNLDCYQEDIYVAIWSAFNLAKKHLHERSISGNYGVNAGLVPAKETVTTRPIRRCFGYAGA